MREDQHTEFKRIWKDDYLKELCAFANSQGGVLYLGVDDNGKVLELKNLNALLENLPNKIHANLGFFADVNRLTDTATGLDYIGITVQPQQEAISYNGKYYIRSGSTTQELRGQELANFLLRKMKLQWDALPRPEATLDDLDPFAWKFFIDTAIEKKRLNASARSESQETVLRKLKLITEKGELTNAALMLFGKDIERWSSLPAYRIGRFGASQADLIMDDTIICPLVLMPDNVMEILRSKYLITTYTFQGLRRLEKLEMPEEGFREIICNAIIHRDYMGTFTQMRVWEDHIQIWNDGTLPPSMTVEKLMEEHESRPRNPLIAKVFFLMGFIENWGRGYEKIRHDFAEEKLQMPVFEEVRGGFMATIQREKFMSVQYNKSGVSGNDRGNDGGNDANPDRETILRKIEERGIKLTSNHRIVLMAIITEPTITQQKISTAYAMPLASVRSSVEALKKKGVLSDKSAKRKGEWVMLL